jgi:hypothetical protein
MRLCRCVFQHGRLLLIALSLTGMLTGVAPVTAQESVQQILQQIGPEQPKGSETGLVMTEEFSDSQCSYCGKWPR